MLIFFILLVVSLIGLGVLLGGKYMAVINLSHDEYPPFWSDFYDLFAAPAIRIHQEKIRPAVYKEIEKLARRFRIVVLRVECLLLRFSEYMRGKRAINSRACGRNSHNSHYWEQLNDSKNGIHKEEEKPA